MPVTLNPCVWEFFHGLRIILEPVDDACTVTSKNSQFEIWGTCVLSPDRHNRGDGGNIAEGLLSSEAGPSYIPITKVGYHFGISCADYYLINPFCVTLTM